MCFGMVYLYSIKYHVLIGVTCNIYTYIIYSMYGHWAMDKRQLHQFFVQNSSLQSILQILASSFFFTSLISMWFCACVIIIACCIHHLQSTLNVKHIAILYSYKENYENLRFKYEYVTQNACNVVSYCSIKLNASK